MKEGWSDERPAGVEHINKFHYYTRIDSGYHTYISLCGMFFLYRRLLKTMLDPWAKCKRCQKSLERRNNHDK